MARPKNANLLNLKRYQTGGTTSAIYQGKKNKLGNAVSRQQKQHDTAQT